MMYKVIFLHMGGCGKKNLYLPLFLASESRNVNYYLNNSCFVSVAMYIAVILIGITAPLSLVLNTRTVLY